MAAATSGFKLTLKLGGSSAAPPHPAPAPTPSYHAQPVLPPPAPTPAPAPRPPKPVAVPSLGPMLPPPTREPATDHRAGESERATSQDLARTSERAQLKEERGVTSSKYRDLKRKYTDVVESRDDTALALFRAQKLISRLREDKHALLDRVLLLESAAGLSSDDVTAAQHQQHTTDRQREFPLLNPPPLPSLDDRARVQPPLTTSSDLSRSSYNTPLGPAPLPLSCPPRHRSAHIQSAVAAEKLRSSNEARRVARGLPKTPFPAVAVLGLEGSNVASVVERALAGEQMAVASTSGAAGAGGKRRRESSSNDHKPVVGTGGKGKGRPPPPPAAAPEYSVPSHAFFPNPFAGGAGAVPDGAPLLGRQPLGVVAPPPPPPAAISAPDADMASPDSDDDQDDVEQHGGGKTVAGGSRKHRAKAVNDAAGAGGKSAKTRRLTGHGITTHTFQIPFVQRNLDGTPILPLTIGVMILRKLGVITSRPNYATERYLFPIGFECTRRYPSMIDRTETVEYVCRIVDGGDSPRFEIDAADQPGVIISANTPTGAWTQVVKQANLIRQRNHSNSVSGPEYYGLAALPIKALIQELPGANSAPAYVWQHFVEEPDPAAPQPQGVRPAAIAGVSKVNRVVGKKRKALKAEDDDDDVLQQQQHALGNSGGYGARNPSVYSDTAYSRSSSAMQGSMSPQQQYSASAYQPDPSSASLANLVNSSSNPYDLPPPLPYDPYALPLPQASPYHSPSIGGSPHALGAAGGWGAPSPWYDDQAASVLHGSASPYGVSMHRSPTNGSM